MDLLLEYCRGNIAVYQEFSFSEILEIIDYQREKDDNEILLKAYQISYGALMGVSFEDFKTQAKQAAGQSPPAAPAKLSAEEIEKQTEAMFENNKWEVRINNGD